MKTRSLITLGVAALTLFCVAAAGSNPRHKKAKDSHWHTVVIDVACDGRTYAANGIDPDTGVETRGSTFIVNGKLFPGGTIPDGDGFDLDVEPDDIGDWVCRGTWNFTLQEVFDGAIPHVSSTQHFLLGDHNSVMTEGPEGGHEPVDRVVLGGTGYYRGVVGEATEEFLGYNSTGFENFRVTFQVRKAAH